MRGKGWGIDLTRTDGQAIYYLSLISHYSKLAVSHQGDFHQRKPSFPRPLVVFGLAEPINKSGLPADGKTVPGNRLSRFACGGKTVFGHRLGKPLHPAIMAQSLLRLKDVGDWGRR